MAARGRPRSERSRSSILEAALRLALKEGYARITTDRIAAEAGVGKQTIYRWWPSKAAVLLEALREDAQSEIGVPDLGSLKADLHAFLQSTFNVSRYRPGINDVLGAMMAEAQHDRGFFEDFRRELIDPRRDVLRSLVKRAQRRKEVRKGADVDFYVDIAFGVMWYRLLAGVGPIDSHLAVQLSELLSEAVREPAKRQPAVEA
jgi:AcrR family transcriptional regulator